jgi:hypothetical protein
MLNPTHTESIISILEYSKVIAVKLPDIQKANIKRLAQTHCEPLSINIINGQLLKNVLEFHVFPQTDSIELRVE